jgi:glycerol kinase
MASSYILAIDQGTTSSRAVVYDAHAQTLGSASQEFAQHYPQPGWVEHEPEDIWQSVAAVVPRALADARIDARQLAAVGVTNQRETTILWERANGRPVGRALVWQDRRTAEFCRMHRTDEEWLHQRTGLVLDPYFSATKLHWLLEQDSDRRRQAEAGKLLSGTVDSFLIWRLTGGQVHATDVTNASRTLLVNLRTGQWDEEVCRYFEVPRALLPTIRPSASDYGHTADLGFLPAGIPITGVAGDQQAALFGQGVFEAGEGKCTFGTGAFFLQHTGAEPVMSRHRLLTTVAATVDEKLVYALEGSVFVAGAAVQWLRDGLHLIDSAAKVEALASAADAEQPVIFVPALVGLGAPHWVPDARGILFGLTRATTAAELARASLEGVAFQVADLIEAARKDGASPLRGLRVDGGMARNDWFLQCQADVLGLPVLQAAASESTALGAAFLAGLQTGIWSDLATLRKLVRQAAEFTPRWPDAERRRRMAQWQRAVEATIAFYAEK